MLNLKISFSLFFLLVISTVNASVQPSVEQQTTNIVCFARTFNYIKYFYPIKLGKRLPWHTVAKKGLEEVRYARNNAELRDKLKAYFKPIAPLVVISAADSAADLEDYEGKAKLYHYKHTGTGFDRRDLPNVLWFVHGFLFHTQIRAMRNALVYYRAPKLIGYSHHARLADSVFITCPVFISGRDFRKFRPVFSPDFYTPVDTNTAKLAYAIEVWGAFRHFNPVIPENWDEVLPEVIKEHLLQNEKSEARMLMARIISFSRDAHSGVRNGHVTSKDLFFGERLAEPFSMEWIDSSLVITAVNPAVSAVQRGDVVVSVGGKTAVEILDSAMRYTACALEKNRLRVAASDFTYYFGRKDKKFDLVIRRKTNGPKDQEINVSVPGEVPYVYVPKKPVSQVSPGIWLVNADVEKRDFNAYKDSLQTAKGIIVDLRVRPSLYFFPEVMGHFVKKTGYGGRFMVPRFYGPDQEYTLYKEPKKFKVKPAKDRFSAPVIFLIDHHSYSYGETCVEFIKANKVGQTLGTTTSGTNGTVNQLSFYPYVVPFSGTLALNRDGSKVVDSGFEPDFYVPMKRADLYEKQDTQVKAAVALLVGN